MSRPTQEPYQKPPKLARAAVCVVIGAVCVALSLWIALGEEISARAMFSEPLWRAIVSCLGGELSRSAAGPLAAEIPFPALLIAVICVAVATWTLGAAAIKWRSERSWRQSLAAWGGVGWLWWLLPGVWLVAWLAALLAGWQSALGLLLTTPQLWASITLAGWLAVFVSLLTGDRSAALSKSATLDAVAAPSSTGAVAADDHRVPKSLWAAVAVYALVFTAMNWQLYRGLLVPHGDSAMYEEHLWNLEHGKGFRSYLDPGLFLGEHIQVIHVLLVPLHLLWPSHLLLELCESLALASGAIPVYWLARRHTGSDRAALLLGAAYLLYFPLQSLDIAIDLKTFRPTSFGVPLLLFALDALERRKYATTAALLVLALAAKEDYALVVATLGLWVMCCSQLGRSGKGRLLVGGALATFAVAYLLVVLTVLIPYFREGGEAHYTTYFGWLGATPREIAERMLRQPALWLERLLSARSFMSALALLVPLGFLPLSSPSRLAVGVPLFGVLCLMELSDSPGSRGDFPLVPFHHFHAPLVPVLFWAAAAGVARPVRLPRFVRLKVPNRLGAAGVLNDGLLWRAHFAWTSALATGLFFSLTPLGISFWDPGTDFYWSKLYVPGKRAERFERVLDTIPQEARVASTDFVHPRFTHYERSYDYSHYRRRVAGYQDKVPDDTDYIVIDTQHPYSEIKRPRQVREFRQNPDRWQLLLDDGYFIVLKRKQPHRPAPTAQ